MSVFDIGSAQASSLQSAATTVATSLLPKKHTVTSHGISDVVTAKATASSTSTTAGASTGANITSNDFLTLLVNELKNQDPTQPTDPNAYISQLVGVNSLQQLIQINQGITTLDGATTSTTGA